MNTGYKELDEAIKAHIATGHGVHPIYARHLLFMAARELGREYVGGDKEWRLIDRRLQALKKDRQILYSRPASIWVLLPDREKVAA